MKQKIRELLAEYNEPLQKVANGDFLSKIQMVLATTTGGGPKVDRTPIYLSDMGTDSKTNRKFQKVAVLWCGFYQRFVAVKNYLSEAEIKKLGEDNCDIFTLKFSNAATNHDGYSARGNAAWKPHHDKYKVGGSLHQELTKKAMANEIDAATFQKKLEELAVKLKERPTVTFGWATKEEAVKAVQAAGIKTAEKQ